MADDTEDKMIGDFYLTKDDWKRIHEHNTPEWRAENLRNYNEAEAAKDKAAEGERNAPPQK